MTDRPTVLLVDDDPTVAWALGRFLTRRGFAVAVCSDGSDALQLLQKQEFESLISDVQLPSLNGLALVEWARLERPRMRVIVMTAFGSESIRAAALRKGAILYAEKPADPELVFEMLTSPWSHDRFSGSVSEIDLFDYIQLMLVTHRRVILDVTERSGRSGRLFIDTGRVVSACCEGVEGEEAFFRCLSFEGGSFATLPWHPPDQVTIDKPGEFLLLDAARIRDEAGRSGVPSPSLVPSSRGLGDLGGFDLEPNPPPGEIME